MPNFFENALVFTYVPMLLTYGPQQVPYVIDLWPT